MPLKPMVDMIYLFELYNHVGSHVFSLKLLFKKTLEEGTFPEE